MSSVNKQPLLTGFPRTVFANSQRRHQAVTRRKRDELAELSPSGYGVMFEDVLPTSFLASIDPTQRQRRFGHIPVLWAWVSQIFEGNASPPTSHLLDQSHGIWNAGCRIHGARSKNGTDH